MLNSNLRRKILCRWCHDRWRVAGTITEPELRARKQNCLLRPSGALLGSFPDPVLDRFNQLQYANLYNPGSQQALSHNFLFGGQYIPRGFF